MTSRDFCYWLQGYFELTDDVGSISANRAVVIKKHLALVFKHEIDPSFADIDELKQIHNPHSSGDQQIMC